MRLFAFLLVVVLMGCEMQSSSLPIKPSPPTNPSSQPAASATIVTATTAEPIVLTEVTELSYAIETNPASASIKYKGKVIEAAIKVEKIEESDGKFYLKQATAIAGNVDWEPIKTRFVSVEFNNPEAIKDVVLFKKYVVRFKYDRHDGKKIYCIGEQLIGEKK